MTTINRVAVDPWTGEDLPCDGPEFHAEHCEERALTPHLAVCEDPDCLDNDHDPAQQAWYRS